MVGGDLPHAIDIRIPIMQANHARYQMPDIRTYPASQPSRILIASSHMCAPPIVPVPADPGKTERLAMHVRVICLDALLTPFMGITRPSPTSLRDPIVLVASMVQRKQPIHFPVSLSVFRNQTTTRSNPLQEGIETEERKIGRWK